MDELRRYDTLIRQVQEYYNTYIYAYRLWILATLICLSPLNAATEIQVATSTAVYLQTCHERGLNVGSDMFIG